MSFLWESRESSLSSVDRSKFERFQEEIYRSEDVQQSWLSLFLFLFLHFPHPPPPVATFFPPPRWKPVGSRKEISSCEFQSRDNRGERVLEKAVETAAAPSVPLCKEDAREKERGWDKGWETSLGWLSLVITLLGSVMECVACHGTWASWSVSTIGPRWEKVIDERSRRASCPIRFLSWRRIDVPHWS